MNNNKNKLNSKTSWLFNLEPNAHLVCTFQLRYLFPPSTLLLLHTHTHTHTYIYRWVQVTHFLSN